MKPRGRIRSPLALAAAGCVALALLSLALPSGPGYDQYAWLLWGRDLAHLGLSVGGSGTSWKPFPALIDALLAPLGNAATYAWVVIARAGALFALFIAFRVAWRLASPPARPLAGIVAAASLALTHDWLRHMGVGNSEGLLIAFGLLAVDRHIDRRHGQAFALLVAAGLIRVEIWPFIATYGLWLAWRTGGRRVLLGVALGGSMIPLLWFGGDWLGSGRLTTGADRALQPIRDSAGASAHPALAVAQEALTIVPLPVWIAIVIGLVAALVRRTVTPVVALTACAAAWTAIVAVMAERGYGGLPRFLFMASAFEAVAAGVAAAGVVTVLARRRSDVAAALASVACLAFAFGSAPDARLLPQNFAGIDKVADMDTALAQTVRAVGGPLAVVHCGTPTTTWWAVTALAWDLGVSPSRILHRPVGTRQVVFKPTGERWRVSETHPCAVIAAHQGGNA